MYAELGELDLALADLWKARALAQQVSATADSLASICDGIGYVLAALGRFEEVEGEFAAALAGKS